MFVLGYCEISSESLKNTFSIDEFDDERSSLDNCISEIAFTKFTHSVLTNTTVGGSFLIAKKIIFVLLNLFIDKKMKKRYERI